MIKGENMGYILPNDIKEAVQASLGEERFTSLQYCLDDLDSLNTVFLNDIDFNFDELENVLTDVITYCEDEDDLPMCLVNSIAGVLIDYIKLYGIVLEENVDIKISLLYTIIDVLEKLYRLDNSLMEEYLDTFTENLEKDDEEVFAGIIASMSELNYTDVYEVIEYVSKDLFKRFIKFYQKEIDARTVELAPDVVKMIDGLGKIDERLLNTYIIRYITKYGYTPMTFDALEDTLYDVIQGIEYTSNADRVSHPTYEDIAREIAMFMYIATDTRGKTVPLLPDKVSLTWADDLYPEQNINKIPGSVQISNAYDKIQAIVNLRMSNENQ